MIAITIETNDVCYRLERREDGSGRWDWRLRLSDGSWGQPLEIDVDGCDVLWQVAGLCDPPTVQDSSTRRAA